jgi:TRAP-type C4-dicarboxylate transport system permease large subunit
MTLLIMVGNLTPPVGMCLFAVSSFSNVSIGALMVIYSLRNIAVELIRIGKPTEGEA